ncbi:MAG: hypothetical protein WAK16_13060 [Candidatus Cybelea sp.]
MRSLISVFYASTVCVALVGCSGGGGSQLAPPGAPSGVAPDSQMRLRQLIGSCQLFPNPDSFYAPYNVNISRYPVNPNSANYMATYRGHIHANFGYAPNTGFPINVVPRNQPLVPIRFTNYPHESDRGPYPIPDNARIEGQNGGSDRHLIVLQQGTCEDYEMFHAARSRRAGWTAANGAKFNLTTGNARTIGWTSADAAGTPIIAGLIRCDEIANGSIDHAMNVVISVPTQHGFIFPGTHWNGPFRNPNYLPMGARLRIKASYNVSRFTGQALTIAKAGKMFGFIVMDGAPRHFQLEGETGTCWNAGELAQLNAIPTSALEVVETGNVITGR